MRYHLRPVRMAIKSKPTNNCCEDVEKKSTLVHCWQDCKLVQPLWKTVWRIIKKLKIELPYDLTVPLLGIYLKKSRTVIWKAACIPVFIAVLFTIAKIWMWPKNLLIYEWIKKWYTYKWDIMQLYKRMKHCHLWQHGWT